MMKFIITASFIFLCGNAYSQIYVPVTPTTYGNHTLRDKTDSARHIPEKNSFATNTTDTTAQIFYYRPDSSIYGYSRAKGYFKISGSGGGGTTDTTPLHNQILLRVKYSDTAAMLANYKTKIEQHSDSLTKVVKLRDSTTIYYPRFSNPSGFITSATYYDSTLMASRKWVRDSLTAVRNKIVADSIVLQNSIATKLNITDTTGKWVSNIRRSNDSVFILKNTTWTFVYKDSTGSVVTPSALTKSDDTNVTLTLGGTPSTALLQATSLSLGWIGQLAISRGGTGQLTANAALNAFLPSQTGNNGKVLGTDGSNAAWVSAGASSFTETAEEFTGSTSSTVTVSNSPLTSKARMVYMNGVLYQSSNVSQTGAAFTLSGITRETSDVITVKYSY